MLSCKIVEKMPFTVVGIKRRFNTENCLREIPKFWSEWMRQPGQIKGMFGVRVDESDAEMEYWIADDYVPGENIPEGCGTFSIPGGLWAVFTCRGPLPESLQAAAMRVWTEWLPGQTEYELNGNYSLEVYTPPPENLADTISYIWLPVRIRSSGKS